MGKNNYFQFKQFKIIQEKSAMKVGTDGVLLGFWANCRGAKTILDVGTGTGLIALMLAQRSSAQITGIEIEKNASEEAVNNVQNSPWSNRVDIEQMAFQQYVNLCDEKFDLIVSNPPFFENSLKSNNLNRSLARHSDSLPFSELIAGVKILLNKGGILSLILPVSSAKGFIELANKSKLYLSKLTEVKPKASADANRYLMEFGRERVIPAKDILCIYNEIGKEYTLEFKKRISEFYLNH